RCTVPPAMAIDERLLGALHVEQLQAGKVHGGHDPHQIFQASTIATLLDGALEGDVNLAELSGHGDLGLGTYTAADGELIIVDGDLLRADIQGRVSGSDPW